MYAVSILLGLAALPAFSIAATSGGVPTIAEQAPREAPVQVCGTKGAANCQYELLAFGEVCDPVTGPVGQVMVENKFKVEVNDFGHIEVKDHEYPVECKFYTTKDCSGNDWKADSGKTIAVGEHGMPSGILAAKCKGPKAPKV